MLVTTAAAAADPTQILSCTPAHALYLLGAFDMTEIHIHTLRRGLMKDDMSSYAALLKSCPTQQNMHTSASSALAAERELFLKQHCVRGVVRFRPSPSLPVLIVSAQSFLTTYL